MRIFASHATLPRPDQNAGDRRFSALLEILAHDHDVDFWAPSIPMTVDARRAGYDEQLRALGVNVLSLDTDRIGDVLGSDPYDVAWFENYLWSDWILDAFVASQPAARVIVDSVDVHCLRAHAAADVGAGTREEAVAIEQREMALYRRAYAVVAVTGAESDYLTTHQGLPRVFVVPNVLPIVPREARDRAPDVLFVGGFAHPPNAHGITWFVREAWHAVRSAIPDARLHIVGGDPPADVRALDDADGVTVYGHVRDVGPALDRALVSVAPLRYGAGLKGKVCEAFAHGVAVVTTSIGAQGIPAVAGVDFMVADDPVGLASSVIALLREPARAAAMGRAGQRIAALYTPEIARARLRHMFDTLAMM
jgi:glycosyltransferase involved in cell wall biosynthesis